MARAKWALLGILGIVVLAGTGVFAASARPFGGAPAQPIPFPHDVHAGNLQIPCMYCHYTADRSPDAGIPSVQTCAGCHLPGGVPLVVGTNPGAIQQLAAYWEQQLPIPWVRIHKVPDHVQFPHMMHVNAGLECQQCHGPVETMAEVEQYASLRMGWCIECHRERGARTDCAVCHY
ncbi:MAG TPA: cytochrome c3 family protein [Longimicrobiales bacterium]|nr:cytochrome c3 family protein [Longimicrobiales bacterium]